MKGIIRGGIRYISHMFDEKEPEMEIGNPTDVKHVAHIGWEGPDASKPSWMTEYHKSAAELENENNDDSMEQVFSAVSPTSTDTNQVEQKPKHRSRRSSGAGANSPVNSPGRKSTDKHSKRSAAAAIGSPVNSSPKQNRRYRNLMSPKQSPGRDQAAIPKHSRPRKSKKDKNSSKDGPEASEPKVKKSYASHLSSVLEVYDEEEKQIQHTDNNSPDSKGLMMVENSDFPMADANAECIGVH